MSNQDRELLELAARAAGIELRWHEDGTAYSNNRAPGYWGVWNPIADDGDALRLAVRLGHRFGFTMETGGMAHWGPVTYTDYKLQGNGEPFKYSGPMETHGSDPYTATRRAIVRAAAAIGSASHD